MNKLHIVLMLIAFPFTLSAGEKVSRSLPADPSGSVEISVIRGSVSIRGWDQSNIQVEGTLDDNAEKLIFERVDSRVTLEVKVATGGYDGKGSQLIVHVPLASRLEIHGISTDVSITGTGGLIDIQTVSGDLRLKNLDGSVETESISGDVYMTSVAGNVEANSVSGDVTLNGQGDAYELATVSGDIRMTAPMLNKLEAATVSGDIQIQGRLSTTAVVALESMNGDITLALQDEINARFDLQTGPGGDIRNEVSDEQPVQERYTGAEALSITTGSGSGRVKMETFSGTLLISR